MPGSYLHPIFKHIHVYEPKKNLTSRVTDREINYFEIHVLLPLTISFKLDPKILNSYSGEVRFCSSDA